ncbi:helix-turn-helix domain-containing protein [Streptomyces sp. SCSIO ZS0520]|uniref:helix-turn-helix domain-containing protein n=1 Tax=Streptomyces sp. SCSIO ZS0520 TaxID=2892996 RepID=UPI0021D881B9|nr:helix-turn-helix domain-containing protein [Streptomyces sp. SCSIO ZS0520]
MEPSALTILELLAEGAPAERLEAFAARARRGESDARSLAAVEEGVRLGRTVHERCEQRRQREAGLSALLSVALELAAPLGPRSLLDLVTRRARLLLGTDLACVVLPGADGGPALVRAADGHVSARTVGLALPTLADLGDAAVTGAIPVWTPDYPHDERVRHSPALDAAVAAEGVRGVLVAPLGRGGPGGALYLADRSPRHFTHEEVSLVGLLGELVGAALEKATALERARTELSALSTRHEQSERRLRTTTELRELHHRLIGRALEGAAPSALAEAAAARTGGVLRVLAADGTVLDTTGGAPAWGDEEGDGPAAVAAHTAGRPVALGEGRWAAPVRARGTALGTVLLRQDRPVTDTDVQVLGILAEAMAVLLLGVEAGSSAAPGRRRDGHLDDLLTGPSPLVGQTGRYPLDPGRPHVVLVALTKTGELGRAVAWAALHAHRTGGLAGERRDLLVLVLPGTDPGQAARAVMDELAPLLDGAVTLAGAGPVTHQAAASAAFEEAHQCLDAMIALGATGCAASARELGFFGALLSDDRDVPAFVHAAIGPVLDYDRQRFTELTKTLEAWFRSGGSPTYAAQQLFVHPNTVSRRLERIGGLLGPDWQQPDHTLKIQLALRLHGIRQSLLARRGGAPDEITGRPG